MKLFYDHLVLREEISKELRNYELTVEEHIEIVRLADETLQIEIMDVILSELPEEKHKEFLEKFHAAPHDEKLLEYLSVSVTEKIKERGEKTKAQILSEIKKSAKVKRA